MKLEFNQFVTAFNSANFSNPENELFIDRKFSRYHIYSDQTFVGVDNDFGRIYYYNKGKSQVYFCDDQMSKEYYKIIYGSNKWEWKYKEYSNLTEKLNSIKSVFRDGKVINDSLFILAKSHKLVYKDSSNLEIEPVFFLNVYNKDGRFVKSLLIETERLGELGYSVNLEHFSIIDSKLILSIYTNKPDENSKVLAEFFIDNKENKIDFLNILPFSIASNYLKYDLKNSLHNLLCI